MKTITRVFLIVLVAALSGCGGGDDGGTTPTPVTDEAILALGWTAWDSDDFAGAEIQFQKLLDRDALLAEAHDGLGWTFSRTGDPGTAATHFADAVVEGVDATTAKDQARAGQCFAESALGHHQNSLVAGALVAAGWVFGHDGAITRDDVVVTNAVSHYALGDFAASLADVQVVAPAFTADVGTVDGRALLAAKIEELTAG